ATVASRSRSQKSPYPRRWRASKGGTPAIRPSRERHRWSALSADGLRALRAGQETKEGVGDANTVGIELNAHDPGLAPPHDPRQRGFAVQTFEIQVNGDPVAELAWLSGVDLHAAEAEVQADAERSRSAGDGEFDRAAHALSQVPA